MFPVAVCPRCSIKLSAIAEDVLVCLNRGRPLRVGGKDSDIAAGEINVGIAVHRLDHRAEPSGLGDAVGVDEGQQLRSGAPGAQVSCRTGTWDRLMLQPHPLEFGAHSLRKLG